MVKRVMPIVELCSPEAAVKRATKTENLFCDTGANALKSDVLRKPVLQQIRSLGECALLIG